MASATQNEIFENETPSAVTHNGWFTVENPKTGEHRTFEVKTRNFGTEDKPAPKRVVSLLTGPNRESRDNWKAFAFATDSGVKVWKKEQGGAFDKYAAILTHVDAGERYGLIYMVESRCRVCNRPLTNPESIRSGIGPICAGLGGI